jgi:CHAT domain-containing protein/Tfp pilus assembly protein PilF
LLHQRALAIREKVLGSEHADTAGSLNNLAAIYDTLGQYDQALPLYQRALAIREKVLGLEHADTAGSLNNLAYLYKSLGQYDQALPLYHRALAIREKVFGFEHADTANSLNNIAFFHGEQHHSLEALHWAMRAQTVTDHVIQHTFPILTEQQKLNLVKMKEGEMHGMLSLIHRQLADDPTAILTALNLVLSRKGIVFDAQARQQDTIARSLDPKTKKLWDELSNQRSELAKLMQGKPERLSREEYQKHIADYQSQIGKLETQIASKSTLVAQELKQRQVTSKEVAAQLGKNGVLVEYTKLQDYDWDHGKWSDTWRYLAFILHGDGKIQMIDLGNAAELEGILQPALHAVGLVGGNGQLQQQATRTLYQQLWQPIAAAVGEANKVVFSPDGLLNLVPFAAMQDVDDHYLIESRQVSYVTSGRDITKGDLGIKPESDLYLAANPKFDMAFQVSPASASEETTKGAVRSAGFGMHFSPLPGTVKEAEQIPGNIFGKKVVLTGKEATEDSVLSIRRPRVMHLSTHGFFLSDQAAISQGTRGASRIDAGQTETQSGQIASVLPQGYENPLVRSGLAFAGANHAGDAKDGRDGLLTALEVSGMDLHGTDLVTLSACETGRGEVKSGEGVFGLRRAFALAGTRHLMMSLWPVSDDVTAQQMQSFYQLYGKKTNPAAALRQAQLTTIAQLRSKRGQAEPALWAPFIVQGW